MAMNERIKARWVDALRTGQVGDLKITQTEEVLRNSDVDGVARMCCLGVLCKIAEEDGIVRQEQNGSGLYYDHVILDEDLDAIGVYSGEELPEAVMKWAGLDEADPRVEFDVLGHEEFDMTLDTHGRPSLAGLNDNHPNADFTMIADLIEQQL